MPTVTIQEAQAQLPELIHCLNDGDELVITENNQPIARLVSTALKPLKTQRQLGTLKGTVQYVSTDFDEPLEDFKEYME